MAGKSSTGTVTSASRKLPLQVGRASRSAPWGRRAVRAVAAARLAGFAARLRARRIPDAVFAFCAIVAFPDRITSCRSHRNGDTWPDTRFVRPARCIPPRDLLDDFGDEAPQIVGRAAGDALAARINIQPFAIRIMSFLPDGMSSLQRR
jgi:hypothetical protein